MERWERQYSNLSWKCVQSWKGLETRWEGDEVRRRWDERERALFLYLFLHYVIKFHTLTYVDLNKVRTTPKSSQVKVNCSLSQVKCCLFVFDIKSSQVIILLIQVKSWLWLDLTWRWLDSPWLGPRSAYHVISMLRKYAKLAYLSFSDSDSLASFWKVRHSLNSLLMCYAKGIQPKNDIRGNWNIKNVVGNCPKTVVLRPYNIILVP